MRKFILLIFVLLDGCIDKEFNERNQISLEISNRTNLTLEYCKIYFNDYDSEKQKSFLISDTLDISIPILPNHSYLFLYNMRNLDYDRLNIDASHYLVYEIYQNQLLKKDSIQFFDGFTKQLIIE